MTPERYELYVVESSYGNAAKKCHVIRIPANHCWHDSCSFGRPYALTRIRVLRYTIMQHTCWFFVRFIYLFFAVHFFFHCATCSYSSFVSTISLFGRSVTECYKKSFDSHFYEIVWVRLQAHIHIVKLCLVYENGVYADVLPECMPNVTTLDIAFFPGNFFNKFIFHIVSLCSNRLCLQRKVGEILRFGHWYDEAINLQHLFLR